MLRIITAVLAVGILAACDNGPTGPTATGGGEVELEMATSMYYSSSSHGQGYNFVKGQKIEIRSNDVGRLGKLSDIDLWGNNIYAKPQRIYLDNGERVDSLNFPSVGASATFTLRALEDKARCEITIKRVSSERISNEWVINKFFMRYKIEIY